MEKHKLNIEDYSGQEICQTLASSTAFGGKRLVATFIIGLRKIEQIVTYEVWNKGELLSINSDLEKAINHYNNL